METRLTTCPVRLLRTFPPLILLPGQSPNHEQNALALRHRLMSTPISEIRIRTANTFSPITLVKSTPQIRVSSPLRSRFRPVLDLSFLNFFFLGLASAAGGF